MKVKFNELLEFIKEYGKARNYKVFLVFVMISTIFWLLIKFSKEYTTLVSFSVIYDSVPSDMVWGAIPENSLQISTTASGFQHLGYAFGGKKIHLDMSEIRSSGNDQYFLLPEEQISSIIRQFPSNLELIYRSPDSIFFDLSKKISKKIPVILNDSLTLAPSYQFVETVSVRPDSILISGPASLVSKIEKIETELFVKENIRKNNTEVVRLKPLNIDKVESSVNMVNVSLRVEQFTQSKMDVPINIRNVPSGYLLKIFPDNITVTFNIGLSDFESINQSSFRVIADYNHIKEGNSQFIPLDLKLLNDKIELVKFGPSEVEFLLRKID